MATDILRRVWLFSQLDQGQLEAISNFTFQKTFAPGELIVEEGHTGNGLYVIMSGNVEVVKALGTETFASRRPAGDRRGFRRDGASRRMAQNSQCPRAGPG